MTLREQQSLFVVLVARLIQHATSLGWDLTFGEAYRSQEEATRLAGLGLGIANSLHTSRLAIDLNLFIGGVYQRGMEPYRPLGEWWEQQSPLCRWGGRFKDAQGNPKPDANHFSLAYGGRA